MSDFNDLVSETSRQSAGQRLADKTRKTPKKSGQYRGYGMLPTRLWMGHVVPAFMGLPIEAKLLFLYLNSAPAANMAGLYYFRWQIAQIEIGLDESQLLEARNALEDAGLIAYDETTQELWVKDFIKLQVSETPLEFGDNRAVGLRRSIEEVCSPKLKEQCLLAYSDWFRRQV